MHLRAAVFFLTAVAATPAFAQTLPARPFDGPSLTIIAGVDHGSEIGMRGTGVLYGGQLGYDVQSAGTVFGVEGEITGAGTKQCQSHIVGPGSVGHLCAKSDRDLYVGGRLGYVVAESTMIYVKAGYTNARGTFDYRVVGTGASHTSGSGTSDGIRGGVGVETRIGTNLTAKAEYRYSNYLDSSYSRHQGVVGFGFRF
ncbi:MAG: porin family protein [Sphingomonas bacterium]